MSARCSRCRFHTWGFWVRLFLLALFPLETVQPRPTTVQPPISTIQCFLLNKLILVCYPLPCTPSPSVDRRLPLIRPLRDLYSRRLISRSPFDLPISVSLLSATLMGHPASVVKQKAYTPAKSFRCNIYKKQGVGSLGFPLVPLQRTAFGATICKGTRFLHDSGETTPLPPVSKDSERTSGTVRWRSRLQVVPGSSVLTQ